MAKPLQSSLEEKLQTKKSCNIQNRQRNTVPSIYKEFLDINGQGFLADSVSTACDSQSQGHEFKPQAGHGAYLKEGWKEGKKKEGNQWLKTTMATIPHWKNRI